MVDWKAFSDFIGGLLSGIVTVTVCAPLDLTRTRLNLNKTTKQELSGFIKTMADIYRTNGYRGFYDGTLLSD